MAPSDIPEKTCARCKRALRGSTYYWVDESIGKLHVKVAVCALCLKAEGRL